MSYFLSVRNVARRPRWGCWGSMGPNSLTPLFVVGMRYVATKLPVVAFTKFGVR